MSNKPRALATTQATPRASTALATPHPTARPLPTMAAAAAAAAAPAGTIASHTLLTLHQAARPLPTVAAVAAAAAAAAAAAPTGTITSYTPPPTLPSASSSSSLVARQSAAPSNQLASSDATNSAMAAAPKDKRTTKELRADAKAALALFDATKDMGALLRVLGYERRDANADDWKSFTPVQVAVASPFLSVAELASKRTRDAVMVMGLLQPKVGLKPLKLATLYWCSKCADSRKPGPRTRIIQHILGHEGGEAEDEMADDRDDSGQESEEEEEPVAAAAAAASRARPARLARPVGPSSLSDPLESAAAISFFPHDLSTAEVDELLLKHMQFNESVATDAQQEAVHANLLCVKLKDAAVRDAAFEKADAGQIKLTGLSQLKTPHTSYYCRCLQYCFRNIGAMMTHILKTHCWSPAAAAARPRKRRRSLHASSNAVEVETEANLDPTLDHRLRKKQRGDDAVRREESPDDSWASDCDDEGLASRSEADSESDADAGGAAKKRGKISKMLGKDDSAAEIAGLAAAHAGRTPILSRTEELNYMQQMHFRPAEPSIAQWNHLQLWEEARANWLLVKRQIVCQRVPKNLRPAHSIRKNQLLDVPGLSAIRDNHTLFSCRCGTQPFKRLTDAAPLLRHLLWRCPQTAGAVTATLPSLSQGHRFSNQSAAAAAVVPTAFASPSSTEERRTASHAAAAAAASVPSVPGLDVTPAATIASLRAEVATLEQQCAQLIRAELAARQEKEVLERLLQQSKEVAQQQFLSFMDSVQSRRDTQMPTFGASALSAASASTPRLLPPPPAGLQLLPPPAAAAAAAAPIGDLQLLPPPPPPPAAAAAAAAPIGDLQLLPPPPPAAAAAAAAPIGDLQPLPPPLPSLNARTSAAAAALRKSKGAELTLRECMTIVIEQMMLDDTDDTDW